MLLRRIPDRNIWILYAAILLLGVGYGTSIAVLAIHLDAHHIPKMAMGGLAAAFALGIVVLSLPSGWLVQRFGAKRVLMVALFGYACCVGSFPLLSDLRALTAARFVDGACSAAIWVSAETALLSRAPKDKKAVVMSLYAMSIALGYVIGPLVATGVVAVASTSAAFVVAGVLAAMSALTVFTFFESGPRVVASETPEGPYRSPSMSAPSSEVPQPELGTLDVLVRAKTSCFGTFAYGYFQASVVLFLPLFLIASKGVAPKHTILVTAFFAAGMLSLSTWVSRLGDRHGHLAVMRILGSLGGIMIASFVLLDSFPLMCAAVFVAGGTLASISPVSLALQGVVIPPRYLGKANAYYNAAYAVGMLLGPPISGFLFTRWGGPAMLFHLAALWGTFVAFTTVFAKDDRSAGPLTLSPRPVAPHAD